MTLKLCYFSNDNYSSVTENKESFVSLWAGKTFLTSNSCCSISLAIDVTNCNQKLTKTPNQKTSQKKKGCTAHAYTTYTDDLSLPVLPDASC